ncbi:MAG: biopolymer transporter ExbD [Deltaproteobacteria bacterium]|nr:biopolymer transporter ExbD [Deltaproteobacteria bacterium]
MKIPFHREKRKARIEIIPLIDIIFFLLATFVMVSLSMVKNQGIAVNLPTAQTGVTQVSQQDDYTAITITEKGDIFFNKTKVGVEELAALFAELKSKHQDPMIVLNGDEKALLGRAVTIFDEAQKAGIKRFGIASKPN